MDFMDYGLIQQWIQERIAQINANVTAYDVLSRNGVSLKYGGDREEQISCPFHGEDRHPSARYYPEESTERSHIWCFTCHKNWDAIGLWQEYTGNTKFTDNLFQMERTFGLPTPERPSVAEYDEDTSDPLEDEVEALFELCEKRLRLERSSFDMASHLKLGSILDQLHYAVSKGGVSMGDAKKLLIGIKEKIGGKTRAAPSDDT